MVAGRNEERIMKAMEVAKQSRVSHQTVLGSPAWRR
jgi:hypothetical protein